MMTLENAQALARQVQLWKSDGVKIGFVPTMGSLHDGHLSLVKRAQALTDKVVVSIFVNPTQFAPNEDFDSYPRDIESDLAKLRPLGVEGVYLPRVTDLYPSGPEASMKAGDAAKGLESDFRPHFFDGVVTVVHRLFSQVQPDVAVFGEKDYQQLQVIKEMSQRKSLPITIIGAPTARDTYGLALSSRNTYLSDEEMNIARQMNAILRHDAPKAKMLLEAGFTSVDYIEERWGRILGAAWINNTRLIDNVKKQA